jgi:hypothetical protein
MTTKPDPQAIRDLAYRLWNERGRPANSANEDWLEAERQLRGRQPSAAKRVDEAIKESFPASDPPASGIPDQPPANAEEKWAAATDKRKAGKPSRKSGGAAASARGSSNGGARDTKVRGSGPDVSNR